MVAYTHSNIPANRLLEVSSLYDVFVPIANATRAETGGAIDMTVVGLQAELYFTDDDILLKNKYIRVGLRSGGTDIDVDATGNNDLRVVRLPFTPIYNPVIGVLDGTEYAAALLLPNYYLDGADSLDTIESHASETSYFWALLEGVGTAKSGAGILIGAPLTLDAAGKVITATDTDFVIGRAMEAATGADEDIDVMFNGNMYTASV